MRGFDTPNGNKGHGTLPELETHLHVGLILRKA